VPVKGTIDANASTAAVDFPAWEAKDGDADATVTCMAPLGADGTPVVVTAKGPSDKTGFPYGVTVVTCTAKDKADNVSPARSFAVILACQQGYPYSEAAKQCLSE
jgi:hypothetical protein